MVRSGEGLLYHRTRVVGNFPDGNSALILVTARLRCVASRRWGTRKYMNVNLRTGGCAVYEQLEA